MGMTALANMRLPSCPTSALILMIRIHDNLNVWKPRIKDDVDKLCRPETPKPCCLAATVNLLHALRKYLKDASWGLPKKEFT